MNNEHHKSLFRSQVIQKQYNEQSQATNKKRGWIYILIAILILVHMEMNFAPIWIFSFKFIRQ